MVRLCISGDIMLIAQISDIHAAPDNDHLLRLARALAWLTHVQPDALVLTGDLVDGEWRQGYWQIAEQLRQQHYPAFILPGNADDRRLMQTTWHENHWAKNTPADALHFVQDMGGLRLLGLDSTVNKQNFGSVGDHLEWLARQLSDTHGLPALLFLHHPVIASGIPTGLISLSRSSDATGPEYWLLQPGMCTGPQQACLQGFRLIFVAQFARRTRCGSAASRFLR